MSVADPDLPTSLDEPPGGPRLGRPRDVRADEAILNATFDLIAEVGFGGVTVDAVAARAGVGKATIYRRWPSKEALILATIRTVAPTFDPVDTGTLSGDLMALLEYLVGFLSQRRTRSVLSAAMGEAVNDPDLRKLRDQFAKERRGAARTILERARDRGELRPGLDIEHVIDFVTGPIFYRMLLKGRSVSASELMAIVDLALHGIAAEPGRDPIDN